MQCSVVSHDTFWGIVSLLGTGGRKSIDDGAMLSVRASPEYRQLSRCVASGTTILLNLDTIGLPPTYFAAVYAPPCGEAPHYLMFSNVSDMFQRVMDMYEEAASLGPETPDGQQEQRRVMLDAAISAMEGVVEVASLADAFGGALSLAEPR